MSKSSGNPAFSKLASKVATMSGSTQPKALLLLDQLDVDVTGTIVVMGSIIHCSAKSSMAHNFLRMKEGGIYSVKNFVVIPNKDEFRIFRRDRFMIEFDGETSARKVSADPHGFLRIQDPRVLPGKSEGQSLRVTLWGQLGDVLVEKKTRHVGVCAMVLTGMSVKEYNNKLYLSSTSSTVFCDDDDDIPCLQELRADDNRTAPIKAPLPIYCTQPREGTLENLLIWAHNRQNNTATFHCKVMIENFRTKKGWNYPSCGYEKCRKGASRKNGKWVCEACNRTIDYPVFRYRLEVVVADDTPHTVMVMFNETATQLLKFSASLMGTEDEGPDTDDGLNFPLAIRNLIGTTHVLEIKSHTYYEYGTFESFNCWKINPGETAVDDASSSTPAVTANDVVLSEKIVTNSPAVCTPLKTKEAGKQKGHELEDSDADEVFVYVIEFQKRGLPHAHILKWLEEHSKCKTPDEVDDIILDEMPFPDSNPNVYKVVTDYMLHGPCGKDARNAACTSDGKCSKHFPKPFLEETFLDEDGYPHYRQRDNKVTFKKGNFIYDNKHVVPHNRYLVLKYRVHINVEWCNRSKAIKYLFKYLNKGPDRAIIIIEENIKNGTTMGTENVLEVDEIKNYLNCRFLSP
ncbi:DNA helicase PIF1, ATP-dependent [Tanacetum coccineum]